MNDPPETPYSTLIVKVDPIAGVFRLQSSRNFEGATLTAFFVVVVVVVDPVPDVVDVVVPPVSGHTLPM